MAGDYNHSTYSIGLTQIDQINDIDSIPESQQSNIVQSMMNLLGNNNNLLQSNVVNASEEYKSHISSENNP